MHLGKAIKHLVEAIEDKKSKDDIKEKTEDVQKYCKKFEDKYEKYPQIEDPIKAIHSFANELLGELEKELDYEHLDNIATDIKMTYITECQQLKDYVAAAKEIL